MSINFVAIVPLTLAVVGGAPLGLAKLANVYAERRNRNGEAHASPR